METFTEYQNPIVNHTPSLRENVLTAIETYFKSIEQQKGAGLSNLVLEEVEGAMYEGIMRFTRGNQSRAAKLLGVSRGTLRTKLMQHFGTTHVGGIYKI